MLLRSHGIHSTYLLLENVYFISEGEKQRKLIGNIWTKRIMAESPESSLLYVVASHQSDILKHFKFRWGSAYALESVLQSSVCLPCLIKLLQSGFLQIKKKKINTHMHFKATCVAVVLNLQLSHMFSVWQNGWHLTQRASDLLCVLRLTGWREWSIWNWVQLLSPSLPHINLWMSSQLFFHHVREGESKGSVSGCHTREGEVWPVCLSRVARVWITINVESCQFKI